MKVIQATAWYPPYDLGGTEVYVEGLVAALRARGIESTVIVPCHRDAPKQYRHHGTEVSTYPVGEASGRKELRHGVAHKRFAAFRTWLSEQERGIYHQHSWTRGCGLHHFRAARELGFRTVLTVHVPGNICLRGTMMRFGHTPCDGRISETTCGACWAEGRGLARSSAEFISQIPLSLSQIVSMAPGRIATAISARAIGYAKQREFRNMIESADKIVAVSKWLADALIINGVPADKVVLNRQGLDPNFARSLGNPSEPTQSGPLRLLYLGRWDTVKGIDVAVRAVQSLSPDIDVRLSIRAVSSIIYSDYEIKVRELAAGDPRISILPALPRDDLPKLFAAHDVLLVPSRWLETGPLVVLEAQAAGLFILGARLGGIVELLSESDISALLPPDDVDAWATAILRLVVENTAGRLRRQPREVRTMETVAKEMAELYGKLAA